MWGSAFRAVKQHELKHRAVKQHGAGEKHKVRGRTWQEIRQES